MKKTFLAVTLVVLGSAACSSQTPNDGVRTIGNSSSIASELASEGFVVDDQRPSTRQEALHEELSTIYYKHADGRAAILVREDASELGGEIYDASGKILQKLEPQKASGATRTQDDSCVVSDIYWNSSTIYTVEISSCTNGSGTYCWATCDTSGSCNSTGSGCINVSCGCAEAY